MPRVLPAALVAAFSYAGAVAQAADFVRQGSTVAVGGAGLHSFQNHSAVAIGADGDIGVAYSTKAIPTETQTLAVIAPSGAIDRTTLSQFSPLGFVTPLVTATPNDLFLPFYVLDDGGIRDFAARALAQPEFAQAKSLTGLSDEVRARLDEIDCQPFSAESSTPQPAGGGGDFNNQFGKPGWLHFVTAYCNDGRVIGLSVLHFPFVNPDTGVRDAWQTFVNIVRSDQAGANAAVAGKAIAIPDAVTSAVAAAVVTDFRALEAFVGTSNAGPRVTLVTLDADLLPIAVEQITERGASGEFRPTLSVCGHPDRAHYWVVWTDDAGKAVVARIAGNGRQIRELGGSAGPVDVACDPWGNAIVAWWAGGSTVNIVALAADGTVIRSLSQIVSGRTINAVSVALNAAGEAVLGWSNGEQVFVQRFRLSGHVILDATLARSWYSPLFDGEGFIFDIVELGGVPTLAIYYFTYAPDGSGRQAWVVGSGPLVAGRAVTEVVIAEGATFGDAFDPGDVAFSDWGTITVDILGCSLALMRMDSGLFPDLRYLAVPLSPSGIGASGLCGGPPAAKAIDVSYAGSWFNPARDGEGFIFEVVEIGGTPYLVVYYFTYQADGTGRQAWLVGIGEISGELATVPVITATGATYGEDFNPADVSAADWGTIKVKFTSCNSARITYDGAFGEGTFLVQRLTPVQIGAGGDCG